MSTLPEMMRALVLTAPKTPLVVQEQPRPTPKPGEVLVRLAASPINPSDLMTLEGEYGIAATPPLIPGLEGAGIVVEAGPGMLGRYLIGKRVSCASAAGGMWAEYITAPASQCVPLPADVSLGAGAMSAVNPLTAIALVGEARRRGHWAMISTGAGGQLGRMIRKRAREKGVKVINIVRRDAQVDALKAEGAKFVLNETSDSFDADLADLCKQLRCRFAVDAVGGTMTYRLLEALRPRAEILLYGALAQKAISAHPGTMIFKEAVIEGFWLSKWLPRKPLPLLMLTVREATKALSGGFAESEVARIVPLEDAPSAPVAYAADMSAGKTLIRLSEADLGVTPSAAAPR
ncbi:MAG: zinc-binding dehydrogenase [Pseudomonadota bacterium]